MKTLISIGSWIAAAERGLPQSQRDTWLKDVSKYPGLDYKFFYGDNNSTEEDETVLNWSYESLCIPAHGNKYAYKYPETPFVPGSDEVVLEKLPDDHRHNTFKTKRALQWALNQEYDHIFICGVDTYVDLNRLMNSGFEKWDYTGTDQWNPKFAGGGPGYWLSRSAAKIVANSPVVLPMKRFGGCEYVWGEDTWVGGVLNDADIQMHPDRRYVEWPLTPCSFNDTIASHLGVPPFTSQRMRDVHEMRYKTVEQIVETIQQKVVEVPPQPLPRRDFPRRLRRS